MNLYLIAQSKNNTYDTYDSAVVAAPDEQTARNMNPTNGDPMTEEDWNRGYNGWVSHLADVTVRLVGTAVEGTKQGVVCASYNAG